jgi:hypothetical protein
MGLLLTYSQQQAIKKISENNEAKYNQLASEVEETELRSLLGVALLQNLQTNPTESANVILLDGGSYENYLGQTITFKGLRYVLAYLNYSKYIGQSFVNDTYTGFTRKNHPDADAISEGTIKRLQGENRAIAMSEWELIHEFLRLNSDDYSLWIYFKSKKPFTPRISGVRKTILGNERGIIIDRKNCDYKRII